MIIYKQSPIDVTEDLILLDNQHFIVLRMEPLNQIHQNVLVSYGSNASQEMKWKNHLSWFLLMNKIFNDQYCSFT